MRVVGGDEIDRVLNYPDLVETLRQAFRAAITVPARHHHAIARAGAEATLILMPAWSDAPGGHIGVKIVSVFPDNATRGKASVMGTYLLLAGESGEPLAAIDVRVLTLWRTAAASALAASYLARADARRMVMVGAGALAPHLIAAHAAVRPLEEVTIWNRRFEPAAALAARLDRPGLKVRASADLAGAVSEADIVSAATLSDQPLIRGAWLKQGAHVDLVGAYTPRMREADDEAIRRARVYVDTRAGALHEAGDIVQPMAAGVLSQADIVGDLFDLARGTASGRRSDEEITLFKSVGSAIEDLAAAVHVYRRLDSSAPLGLRRLPSIHPEIAEGEDEDHVDREADPTAGRARVALGEIDDDRQEMREDVADHDSPDRGVAEVARTERVDERKGEDSHRAGADEQATDGGRVAETERRDRRAGEEQEIEPEQRAHDRVNDE
jgi:ornithine cyclodeaminase/alanine dehydrogenase-like protein (mu-crystallin family)